MINWHGLSEGAKETIWGELCNEWDNSRVTPEELEEVAKALFEGERLAEVMADIGGAIE